MLRQKPCVLVIENLLGRFYRTAHAWYYVTHMKISASDEIQSLENHNYRTRRSTSLVQCSFSSLSHSLDEHLSNFFLFDSLKGFYWKDTFWTIVTTVSAIVYTLPGTHFLHCQIL